MKREERLRRLREARDQSRAANNNEEINYEVVVEPWTAKLMLEHGWDPELVETLVRQGFFDEDSSSGDEGNSSKGDDGEK